MTSLRLPGPAVAHGDDMASFGGDDDVCVDTAGIVFRGRGDQLVMHGDEGGVDDPRPAVAGGVGARRIGEIWNQLVNDSVHCRSAGAHQCGQRGGGGGGGGAGGPPDGGANWWWTRAQTVWTGPTVSPVSGIGLGCKHGGAWMSVCGGFMGPWQPR